MMGLIYFILGIALGVIGIPLYFALIEPYLEMRRWKRGHSS